MEWGTRTLAVGHPCMQDAWAAYGGIHFGQDELDARATGRLAARRCWHEVQQYLAGEARD